MKKYQGKISGVGNATSRKNEITADDLAILRNYIYGWEYGVINRSGWNFNATTNESKDSVIVEKGIMFAYGYFGIFPETYTIPFIKPSAKQYRFIYAEIDRSVVPNTCTIKVKNNQSSDKIKPTTFRQDYLTAVRTGVFQLPLWRVELNSEGIKEVVDVRDLKDYIMKVQRSNYTTDKITGEISPKATATTQSINDNSEKLATTKFVHLATRHYIDSPRLTIIAKEINGVVCEPKQLTLLKEQSSYFTLVCNENIKLSFKSDTYFYEIADIKSVVENGIKTIKVWVETTLNFDGSNQNESEEFIMVQV